MSEPLSDRPTGQAARDSLRREIPGLLLLAGATVFAAVLLAPEARISVHPVNDSTFHLVASQRIGEAMGGRDPLLDPWVSEWSLGYPLWRSYQPLPHLAAALTLAMSNGHDAQSFAFLQLLLLILLPFSVYLGGRTVGLTPLAAGLASFMALAPNGAGEFGRYGLGLGATTWRGSGLFTQLLALLLLTPTLGVIARTLDGGRRRPLAAALLAATSLSHIVFGYVAFVSGAVLALAGPRGARGRRLVRLATIAVPALLLLAWFVVPLALDASEVNRSRWEAPFKWDSYGAPVILEELAAGRLLDSGRLPVLTVLLGLSVAAAAFSARDVVARRLLALSFTWLALFFGRATWGHLMLLVGIPATFHGHRLQAAFELAAVLLSAWGTDALLRAAWRRSRNGAAGLALLVAAGLSILVSDRAAFLRENTRWGAENRRAVETEGDSIRASLTEARTILGERPGRISAGKAATWGGTFRVGSTPFYSFLTRERFDQVSFLYHSMSLTSDIMVLRDESSAVHDVLFGVRAVITPRDLRPTANLRLRAVHGRFAVYEASPEGYFGLVDAVARYASPLDTAYDLDAAWLSSPLPSHGLVIALGEGDESLPSVHRWGALPSAPAQLVTHRGRILSESKRGETYAAEVDLVRPCLALLKITYDPGLRATVDGLPARTIRVSPGFLAIPVAAGRHTVEVRYRPGPLRGILLAVGTLFAAAALAAFQRPAWNDLESRAARRLDETVAVLATPRCTAVLALAVAAVISMRPLLRGRLIDGHDAAEYPPRLVEFAQALGDGHIPPVWARDLGNGHGQPLFAFAPPLVYAAALPFHWLGMRLADSVQLGLFFLFAGGAIGVYRLCRRWSVRRESGVAGAVAWLFSPYVSLDVFARAAFAEAAAVAVAPLALLAMLRALDVPSSRRIALAGAAVAMVVLGHNAAALLVLGALTAVLFARIVSDARRLRTALAGFGAILAGLACSAFFWLPAIVEKRFVKVDLLREGFLHWAEHALAPWQLLWSRWGYGLSVPGSGDGMSFALGPLHLLAAAAGLAVALHAAHRPRRMEALALALGGVAGALLATAWSGPVWARLETLQYLAYPWRALMVPALALPPLIALAVDRLPRPGPLIGVAALVAVNLAHTEPKGYLTFDDEFYAPESIAARGINTTTREEYEPRWVEARPSAGGPRLRSAEAPITVISEHIETHRQVFRVRPGAATTVEIATFHYPGWRAWVDGREVTIGVVPVRGTMSVELTEGEHLVHLELRATPLRRAAYLVTLLSLVGVAAAIASGRRPRSPHQAHLDAAP
jgi:uncharacterized membrane protein